jgi:hypothetical protein
MLLTGTHMAAVQGMGHAVTQSGVPEPPPGIVSVRVVIAANVPGSLGVIVAADDEDGAFVGASATAATLEDALHAFVIAAELHPDAMGAIVQPYIGA